MLVYKLSSFPSWPPAVSNKSIKINYMHALRHNNLAELSSLTPDTIDEFRNPLDQTLLSVACYLGCSVKIISFLVGLGANPYHSDRLGHSCAYFIIKGDMKLSKKKRILYILSKAAQRNEWSM